MIHRPRRRPGLACGSDTFPRLIFRRKRRWRLIWASRRAEDAGWQILQDGEMRSAFSLFLSSFVRLSHLISSSPFGLYLISLGTASSPAGAAGGSAQARRKARRREKTEIKSRKSRKKKNKKKNPGVPLHILSSFCLHCSAVCLPLTIFQSNRLQ